MKKFFDKIVAFLHAIFGANLEGWITDHVEPAISFVENLKAFLSSPVADIITALIPGEVDDLTKQYFLANISKALDVLNVTEAINKAESVSDKLKLLADYLRTLSPSIRNAVYMKFAAQIATQTGNQSEVKGYSVDLLVQSQYSHKKALQDGSIMAEATPVPEVEAAPDLSTLKPIQAPEATAQAAAVIPAKTLEFNHNTNEFHTV